MAEQVIPLPASAFTTFVDGVTPTKRWVFAVGSYIQLDDDLTDNADAALRLISIASNGLIFIALDPEPTTGRRDFTADVESSGVFTLASGSESVDFGIFDADMADPYIWTPTNSAEIIAFYNAIGTSNVAATLTLRDGPKALVLAAGFQGGLAGTLAPSVELGEFPPLSAAASFTGGLAGTLAPEVALGDLPPLEVGAAFQGRLAGDLVPRVELQEHAPLAVSGAFTGNLAGTLVSGVALGLTPVAAAFTGGLVGRLSPGVQAPMWVLGAIGDPRAAVAMISDFDWNAVKAIDVSQRDALGRDRRVFYDTVDLKEPPKAVALRLDDEDGTPNVVAFRTTGAVAQIGDTGVWRFPVERLVALDEGSADAVAPPLNTEEALHFLLPEITQGIASFDSRATGSFLREIDSVLAGIIAGSTDSWPQAIQAIAHAATPGETRIGDVVLLYNGAVREQRVWNGMDWVIFQLVGPSMFVPGGVTTTALGAEVVTAAKVLARTLTADEIKLRTITGSLISLATILNALLADRTILGGKVALNTLLAENILARTITADRMAAGVIPDLSTLDIPRMFSDLAGLIDGADIRAGAIGTLHLGALVVTAAKIMTAAITGLQMADGSITGPKILNATIVGAKILDSTLGESKLDAATRGKLLEGAYADEIRFTEGASLGSRTILVDSGSGSAKLVGNVTQDTSLSGNGGQRLDVGYRTYSITWDTPSCFAPWQYVRMANGLLAPMITLKVGDSLWGPDGFCEIVALSLTFAETDGRRQYSRLYLENGQTVDCTPNHGFPRADGGWCAVEPRGERKNRPYRPVVDNMGRRETWGRGSHPQRTAIQAGSLLCGESGAVRVLGVDSIEVNLRRGDLVAINCHTGGLCMVGGVLAAAGWSVETSTLARNPVAVREMKRHLAAA